MHPADRILRPFLLLAAIALCGLALLAPSASAAEAPPVVSPDAPANRPVPPPLEGLTGEHPSQATTGLLAGSSSAKSRHGLGLPSYPELLGKRWRAKVTRADRGLLRELETSAAPAGGSTAAATPTERFLRRYDAGDVLKSRKGKQTRRLRVSAEISSLCPKSSYELGGFGWFGRGRATYEVATTERVGRWDVTTSTLFDGHFRSRPQMLTTAHAHDFHPADYGEISITRAQVAVDRRSGKRRKIGETERFTSKIGVNYDAEQSFLDLIAAHEDGKPAPKRKLRSGEWKEAAEWFMMIPYDAMRRQVLDGEAAAQTPNRCVQIDVDAPSHLAAGWSLALTGNARLTHDPGYSHSGILERTNKVRAFYINEAGQSARPLSDLRGMARGKPWYEFTAPGAPWPKAKPAGIEFQLISAAGIAERDVTFEAELPTLHFKVLDAEFETSTVASTDHPLCGEVGGSLRFSGKHSPKAFSADDRLEISDGFVGGKVSGKTSARWHDHSLYGCKIVGDGLAPCSEQMPDRTPGTDGIWEVWVSFQAASDPGQINLQWALDDPHVGYFDATDAQCYSYVAGSLPYEAGRQTIPRSKLQGTEPITLSFDGSKHLDQHGGFQPASIDHTWHYELTIQRVDANGAPIR